MGFAREFDGSDDVVNLSKGNITGTGATTYAALVRRQETVTSGWMISTLTSGLSIVNGMAFEGSDKLRGRWDGSVRDSTTTVVPNDGWVIVAVTKATGNQIPRAHFYKNDTWTHEAMSSAIVDATGTVNSAQIGAAFVGQIKADIAAAAFWDTDLTDDEVENYIQWERAGNWRNCTASWDLDQSTTADSVTDQTGGGANQTSLVGTTVITDGPESYYYQTATITGTINSSDGLDVEALMVPDEG